MKKKSLIHTLLLLFKVNLKFIFIIIISVSFTIFLAAHVHDLYFGKNSYEVYDKLKDRKENLEKDIRRLQLENAHLQKEYFELKNLEPEE